MSSTPNVADGAALRRATASESFLRLDDLVSTAFSVTDAELLATGWRSIAGSFVGGEISGSAVVSPPERDATLVAEQFALHPSAVAGESLDRLERRLGRTGFFNFIAALNAVDGYLRVCSLLELEADLDSFAAEDRRIAAEPGVEVAARGRGEWLRRGDDRLKRARQEFSQAVFRSEYIDAETTEVVRLRNASINGCAF